MAKEVNQIEAFNIIDTKAREDIKKLDTQLKSERLDLEINADTNNLHIINKKGEQLGNGVILPTVTNEQINTAIDKAIEDGKITGGGINSTAKNFLQTILQNAVYTTNQSANITALMSALGSTESGGGDTPTIKTYTITSNLTNCITSNISTKVDENSNYIATISPSDGYTLTGASISITMGGSDVTSTVYNNGVINIEKVTGDVIITVSAIQIPQVVNYTITNKLTNCTSNNSNTSIEEKKSYTSTITAFNGYTLTGATVTITMGGTDVTSTVYNNGVVTISKVTGNIVITVSAKIIEVTANEINPSYLTIKDYKTITFKDPNAMVTEMPDTMSFIAKDVQEYWGSGTSVRLNVRDNVYTQTVTEIVYTSKTLTVDDVKYAVITITKSDFTTAYNTYKNYIDNDGKIAYNSSLSFGNTSGRFNQELLPKIVDNAVNENVISSLTW